MSNVQQYLDLYREHRELLEQKSSAPLNAPRAAAAEYLADHPLPESATSDINIPTPTRPLRPISV